MPSNPFTDPQWASRTVDAIDRIVAFVRDRTTRPAVAIVRGLIFGSPDRGVSRPPNVQQ